MFWFFLRLHCTACGILVPQPENKPVSLEVKLRSPNHWTTRGFPRSLLLIALCFLYVTYFFLDSQGVVFFVFILPWVCCASRICNLLFFFPTKFENISAIISSKKFFIITPTPPSKTLITHILNYLIFPYRSLRLCSITSIFSSTLFLKLGDFYCSISNIAVTPAHPYILLSFLIYCWAHLVILRF